MKTVQYGIFNDEGCMENGTFDVAKANTILVERYHPEDDCRVSECCVDHDEEEAGSCQHCDCEE